MEFLGSIAVPLRDEEEDGDGSVCRGVSRMEGFNGLGLVGDSQAPMEAQKGENRKSGLKSYMGTDRDNARSVQASIASIKGVHSGGLKVPMYCDEGKQVDDLSAAAMVAFACRAPPRNQSCGRFLPSNHEEHSTDYFSSDDFRMYEFKVRRCTRGRSHDWTECPFAHPGEKARRRDPRRFPYSGSACLDFRRGACRRGDACELSHGIFEYWLHPARYRTQLCKDGKSCRRRVCFFAHSPSQLRRVSHELVPNGGSASKAPRAARGDAIDRNDAISDRNLPLFEQGAGADGYGGDLYHDDSSSASVHGYGGDLYHDDLSSASVHGFLHDGILDGFSQYTILGETAADVGAMESLDRFSVDERSNPVRGEHTHDSHGHACIVADEFDHDGRHRCRLYPYCVCLNPADSFCFETKQAHLSLRNQLAIASLTGSMEHIMSPTSTLVGHGFSPPLLSPPSSPSDSPPISPGLVFSSWRAAMSQQSNSQSGQPQSQALMAANGAHPSATHFPAPLLASLAHSSGTPPLFAAARGPSPLGDRQHDLEGLGSLPTFLHHIEPTDDDGSPLAGSMEAHPTHAVAHLMSTIKQMQEPWQVRNDVKHTPRTPSNPNTRILREPWELNRVHRRIEGLRAGGFGQLGRREAVLDSESPDIGWVNELVK